MVKQNEKEIQNQFQININRVANAMVHYLTIDKKTGIKLLKELKPFVKVKLQGKELDNEQIHLYEMIRDALKTVQNFHNFDE